MLFGLTAIIVYLRVRYPLSDELPFDFHNNVINNLGFELRNYPNVYRKFEHYYDNGEKILIYKITKRRKLNTNMYDVVYNKVINNYEISNSTQRFRFLNYEDVLKKMWELI